MRIIKIMKTAKPFILTAIFTIIISFSAYFGAFGLAQVSVIGTSAQRYYTCHDTDNGNKIEQPGTLYITYHSNYNIPEITANIGNDMCGGSYLVEYYCKKEKAVSISELYCYDLYECNCHNASCFGNAKKKRSTCGSVYNQTASAPLAVSTQPDTATAKTQSVKKLSSPKISQESTKTAPSAEINVDANAASAPPGEASTSGATNILGATSPADATDTTSASGGANSANNPVSPNRTSNGSNARINNIGNVFSPNEVNITEPIFNIKYSQNLSNVSGFLGVELITYSPIDGAELFLIRENSVDKLFVAIFKVDNSLRTLQFDTNNFPNGDYRFFIKIQYSGVTFERNLDKLSIKNHTQINPVNVIEKIEKHIESPPTINEEKRNELVIEARREFEQVQAQIKKRIEALTDELKRTVDENQETIKEDFEDRLDKEKTKLDERKTQEDERKTQTPQPQPFPLLPPVQNKIEIITKAITDFDKDGLLNKDEIRYNTDPFKADSDNDGYTDFLEVSRGYNPLSEKSEEKIAYGNPKESGETNPEVFKIEKVEIFVAPTKLEEKPKILIQGKGLPNSFVTIFIYSEPIIVTVRTDENGNWSYILDKDLNDGFHEVYVAITNNTGKIIEKSPPLSFIKTAQAISIVESERNIFTPQDAADSIFVDPTLDLALSPKKALLPFIIFITIASVILILIILTIVAKTHAGQSKT